jgi:hypothetical protein
MGGNMCGVIATECKAEDCNNMARYDLYCFKCERNKRIIEQGEEENDRKK